MDRSYAHEPFHTILICGTKDILA